MNPILPRWPIGRAALVAVAALAFTGAALAHGDDDDDGGPRPGHGKPRTCASWLGRSVAGAQVSTAEPVAATATAPAYCRVQALIAPKLNFELRLPADWNRKLHYGGGGGYNGAIPAVDLNALRQGYAQVSSDSGHQGNVLDASFALDDPLARRLFGFESVPTVMHSAQEIVRLHYGQRAKRAYFEGCSNGGREGLIQVQRHPWLFDGVISRAPAYDWVGIMGVFNRTAKALAAPGGAMSAAKVATVAKAVLGACDAADGIADGVVSNPAACHFDAATLRCAGGADTGDACLSDAQLAVVTSWTSPASFVGGRYDYAGWPLTGNEDAGGAWDVWTSGAPSLQFLFSDTTIKNYLAKDPAANSLTYDYESDPTALAKMSALNDATNPSIHPFVASGGKLILWHGGNDSALSIKATIAYYRQVVGALGGQGNADDTVRFYTAPGVNHCAGGPGADSTDLLTPLDRWVGQHKAPGTLTASKLDATGATVFARPLCIWPKYPRYNGSGDAALAASYTCTAP